MDLFQYLIETEINIDTPNNLLIMGVPDGSYSSALNAIPMFLHMTNHITWLVHKHSDEVDVCTSTYSSSKRMRACNFFPHVNKMPNYIYGHAALLFLFIFYLSLFAYYSFVMHTCPEYLSLLVFIDMKNDQYENICSQNVEGNQLLIFIDGCDNSR